MRKTKLLGLVVAAAEMALGIKAVWASLKGEWHDAFWAFIGFVVVIFSWLYGRSKEREDTRWKASKESRKLSKKQKASLVEAMQSSPPNLLTVKLEFIDAESEAFGLDIAETMNAAMIGIRPDFAAVVERCKDPLVNREHKFVVFVQWIKKAPLEARSLVGVFRNAGFECDLKERVRFVHDWEWVLHVPMRPSNTV